MHPVTLMMNSIRPIFLTMFACLDAESQNNDDISIGNEVKVFDEVNDISRDFPRYIPFPNPIPLRNVMSASIF